MDRKQEQVRRYLEGAKREKTWTERKELARRSKQRRASRPGTGSGRRREWSDEDDAEDFERTERRRTRGDRQRPPEVETPPPKPTHFGQVVGVTSGRARVRTERGDVEAVLAPAIAKTQRSSLAVGDEVGLAARVDGSFVLVEVAERRSSLSRPDPSRPDVERVLAANVDVAVIVAALVQPALRQRLIDRYLIAVQRGGVRPIVCANKADLVDGPEERERLERLLDVYAAGGVPTIFTSAATGEGVDRLREELAGRTVVFVGQSGVGKSSLLNAVAPGLDLVVGHVREGDGKGRHTTTASTLHEVPLVGGQTRLVDTPGIRGFLLAGVDAGSLAEYFPEFEELRGGCRFADCRHVHEPDCAVRLAASSGALAPARYETYLRILASFDE